jgi:hypothetical protein
MARPAFVKVWMLLESRFDTTSILKEILGDHSIHSMGQRKDHRLHALAFRLVVRLKVLFDMQRTYLQSCNPSDESRASLIEPSVLLATIHEVIQIGFEVHNSEIQTSTDHLPQPSLIAATALSGLRALMLHSDTSVDAALVQEVSNDIRKWKRKARKYELETFILSKCLLALDSIAPDVQLAGGCGIQIRQPACGIFELEDCARGLVSQNCLLVYSR